MERFMHKINTPVIPVIPGILYILPLQQHLLCNYTSSKITKWNIERHLLLGHSDILAYENFSLKDDKWFMRQQYFEFKGD